MFPVIKIEEPIVPPLTADTKMMNKYKNFIAASGTSIHTANVPKETDMDRIEVLLEREKQNLGTEPWNKLDNRLKIQKLHAFAEKHGHANSLSHKEIKNLKTFFSECLTKDKLAKVKDVDYNKETAIINDIPGLCMNAATRAFTIRNLDKKVSTLKSLTPKKTIMTPINKGDDENE
jgi:hypothetical protein